MSAQGQDIRKRYQLKNKIKYYLIKNLQMNQVEFSNKIGMDNTYLNRIMSGKIHPSGLAIRVISTALGEPEANVFPLVDADSGEDILKPSDIMPKDMRMRDDIKKEFEIFLEENKEQMFEDFMKKRLGS